MKIIKLSGKSVNIEGLIFSEKEFFIFFERKKPWKNMQEGDRKRSLKEDYKEYCKHKPKKAVDINKEAPL